MNRKIVLLIHCAIWSMLLLSPLTFLRHEDDFSYRTYAMFCVVPLVMMFLFYLNYLFLVPRLYFERQQRQTLFMVNAVLTVGLGLFVHYWQSYTHGFIAKPMGHHEPTAWVEMFFLLRDIFNLVVVVAVAASIQMAEHWHHYEDVRLEAEAARVDAELRSLRSQINPHFLLNTLNNIYALTAIDASRAQDAIQKLSLLLRHLLYDNQEQLVNLEKEVDFLRSYTDLMRIRLPRNVEVTFDFEPPSVPVRVAPLLAVSLVENAFKHGVSPTEPSFIHIRITAEGSRVVCDIENSNHPKTELDRSGHGIGLQQVQRRLDLAYPGHYEWNYGPSADGKTYRSTIQIITNSKN